tara:strand:+ start:5562 stop:5843 length:282 start_codon:yes stop_codon:yes gene_type:complete
MPKGTIHRETGILRRAPIGYALEVDGSSRWLLEINQNVRKLVGKRVTVEGKRMGFDLIYVDKIWHEGELQRKSWWSRLDFWIVPVIIFSILVI